MKRKNNHYHWRIPMINLQVFADGEGDGSGAGDGNEDGAGAGSGDSGNEMSFDDFLGQAENRAEFDRRVQKAVNTAVTKAQEKWQALTDDKLSEAEKLAKMTKEEKAEYKNRKLEKELADLGIANWSNPQGGYFISFNQKGCAKRIVSLCKEAGVVLTGAGASFPHGVDPEDENIRISPTFPTEEELQKAMNVFVCAAKLAAAEQALAK